MTYWGILLGLPLLAFGGVHLFSPSSARSAVGWFERSRAVAIVLTVIAWGWTSYEIANYDVNVFREFLGGIRGPLKIVVDMLAFGFDHFWALAPVLAYLTVIWMPKNLSVRALSGILMLFPALMFRTTRLLLPDGFGAVHLFVVAAYVAAVIGMYTMFYPWRTEKALEVVSRTNAGCRVLGAVCAVCGLSLAIAGFCV